MPFFVSLRWQTGVRVAAHAQETVLSSCWVETWLTQAEDKWNNVHHFPWRQSSHRQAGPSAIRRTREGEENSSSLLVSMCGYSKTAGTGSSIAAAG